MFKKNLLKFCTVCALILPFVASANDVRVLNHNFESDAIPLSPNYTSFISGWVKKGAGSIGVYIPENDIDYTNVGGRGQSAFLKAAGKFNQAAKAKIISGETYTLTFDVGRPLSQTDLSLIARINANGLVLAQLQLNSTQVESGTWGIHSLTFTATETMPIDSNVVVEFQNLSLDPLNQFDIDNVTLSTTSTAALIEPGTPPPKTLSIVSEMTTLTVPTDYADINVALRYLDDKYINNNVTVTIQVNDCSNQVYYNPITIAHPQGKQIEIIGNVADLNACVLQFNDSNGFVISGNYNVKKINGFHIKGNRVIDTDGILASKGGAIMLGASTKVSDFHTGIKASYGGKIYANTVLSNFNTGAGMMSQFNGYIQANNSQSNDNNLHGYYSVDGGKMELSNSKAANNGFHGYSADAFGNIKSNNSEASGNISAGFYASAKSFLDATGSISNNNFIGFHCEYSAYLIQTNSTNEGNSTAHTPTIGNYHQNCYMQ